LPGSGKSANLSGKKTILRLLIYCAPDLLPSKRFDCIAEIKYLQEYGKGIA
jgi:hypothetical protein